FHQVCTQDELKKRVQSLILQDKVIEGLGFYALKQNPSIFFTRLRGNAFADTLIPKAERIGHFLSAFPFVRFLGISGSFSKRFTDENTDFDFFIITAADRLWIARTLMHLFKKLTFLFNKQDQFCMNYYIDATHLKIEDQNR